MFFWMGKRRNSKSDSSVCYQVLNKSWLNYKLINSIKDRLISFPDIMTWATNNNVTKCMSILQFTYDSLPKKDDKGRRSLHQYISKLTSQLVNWYDSYQKIIQEAILLRSLLKNWLNLLDLGEHSDEVYKQNVGSKEGKQMRYKLIINNCKLVRNSLQR